jgi:ABC-type multidrug transport system fused ATPase/permease subunit
MGSVEPVLYYTNNIESEAPEFVPENDPQPGTWPLNGEIEPSRVSMRYRDGPLVLKDVSLLNKSGKTKQVFAAVREAERVA